MVILAALTWMPSALAHDVSTSYSRFRVEGNRVKVQFTVGLFDFHNGPSLDKDGDDTVSSGELDSGIGTLAAAIQSSFRVQAPEDPLSVTLEQYGFQGAGAVKIEWTYTFEHDVKRLKVTSTLHRITQPDHQHLLVLGEGEDTRQGVLDIRVPSVEIDVGQQTTVEVFRDFLQLGITHIITGYDHLAFLTGLLIATTTIRSLVKVVTSFTIAHSITLALATFSLVNLSGRWIESMIALTIAYVAIENYTGKVLVHRWKVTFLFGLVHGFGFSNVLQEMELTRRHLAMSLFSFNLGVEAGQLVFVCLVFPLVVLAMKSRWKQRMFAGSSLAIMGLGFYWFVQRAFLT
jgi:HupE / UreJ protein